nr:7sk snrna methylphosphate capping enzyme [Hymenolepis microstoma]
MDRSRLRPPYGLDYTRTYGPHGKPYLFLPTVRHFMPVAPRGNWTPRGHLRHRNHSHNWPSRPTRAHPPRHRISNQSRPSPYRSPRFITNRCQEQSTKKPRLDPTDPLNLHGLMKEADRRRSQGLSPLHGDSRLNTPILNSSGDTETQSQNVVEAINTDSLRSRLHRNNKRGRFYSGGSRNYRRQSSRLPVTGNYRNYYARRDPDSRMEILLFPWFAGNAVADYGCHNGTFTFKMLEKFPSVSRIDAFDCDAELIENARNMQKEKMRWMNKGDISYEKINFQVADWCESMTSDDDPTYDTILAFSVTKWIHLNYGDDGIHRFFRRVFNLLKPGGRLILEPQPKSSYRRTRFTAKQRENYLSMKLDPSHFRDELLAVGFSYFEDLKIPHPGESFQRVIMMCCKSAGDTPFNIRNGFREAARLHLSPSPRVDTVASPTIRPPPVRYNPYNTPSTPFYSPLGSADSSPEIPNTVDETVEEGDYVQQGDELITSTVHTSTHLDSLSPPGEATPLIVPESSYTGGGVDSPSPDSTSLH